MKTNKIHTRDRFKGCLIGLACGDYLGLPFEYKPPHKVKNYFKNNSLHPGPKGYYSDDTAQAICLAESLIENGFNTRDQFIRYKKWLHEGYATPDGKKVFGVGQHTVKVLTKQSEDNLPNALLNDPKAGGNGSLMRCAPIALCFYKDPTRLIDASIKSAIITHNNTIAAWSCVVLNLFIGYALEGKTKDKFCNDLLNTVKAIPPDLHKLLKTNFHILETNNLSTRGYSLHTLTIALHAFFTADNFEDCLTKAILVGGDTDTQGAVSGALAGAYYGFEVIPLVWRNTLMRNEHIVGLAEKLFRVKQK